MARGFYGSVVSVVWLADNDDTGTPPSYGILAQSGSVIGTYSTTPSGSISNTYVSSGGQITIG